jgi:hypothetical protein
MTARVRDHVTDGVCGAAAHQFAEAGLTRTLRSSRSPFEDSKSPRPAAVAAPPGRRAALGYLVEEENEDHVSGVGIWPGTKALA